jgi:hypothetical protein
MNDTFVIIVTMVFTYVHVFNKVATLYFESDRTLTLEDLATTLRAHVESFV